MSEPHNPVIEDTQSISSSSTRTIFRSHFLMYFRRRRCSAANVFR